MPHRRMNSLKARAMNCGPLSEINAGRGLRELLPRPLHDDLDFGFGHRFADFPVHQVAAVTVEHAAEVIERPRQIEVGDIDRKSTRLNSSHLVISYAVFCLKKKKTRV